MKIKHLLLLLILVGGGVLVWPGHGKDFIEVQVNEGQSTREVANTLKNSGLVHSIFPFRVWVKLRRAGPKIQIGRYRFNKSRSSYWILEDLIQGRSESIKIVIPEGFASWQIAERLDAAKVCDGKLFQQVVQKEQLEGFLFPATYELPGGLAPATVAHKFREEFERRWTPEFEQRAKEIHLTKKDVVILASIIEREVRIREELPLISAVYQNRLKMRMRLDADPTVQYALGYWKGRLTYDDYRNTVSPYNTYLNAGLPPGAICSPGLDAIKAVLWPAPSKALYLLATDDGHHTFSESYREHTNKVNRRNRSKR